MPVNASFWESALYALVNFLPPIALALIPFWDKRRFSKPTTVILTAVLTVMHMALVWVSVVYNLQNKLVLPLSIILCALFYFVAIKTHVGKQLFTFVMLANTVNYVMILAKCLEGLVFGLDIAHQAYGYTYTVCTLIVQLVTMLPLGFYLNTYYKNGINKQVASSSWGYLWLIPTTFYFTWLHHLEDNGMSILDIAFETSHALFFIAINMGAFLVYHTVIRMINMQDKNLKLEENNHQLSLLNLQYEIIKDRIAEARRTKHDIRHHIIVLDSYLQKGEADKARDYLQSYKNTLPDDSKIVFCPHNVINALLLYHAQNAKNQKIDYDVVVMDIPQSINLPDGVLTVVIGNILENALEACDAVTQSNRFVTVRGKAQNNSFFFSVENSYNGETVKGKKGEYLSTKNSGRGLGLMSVRSIVERYNGIMEITEKDKIFGVSVFLNIPTLIKEEPQNGDKTE